jgi:polysaccharide export outer membrane protein
VLGPGDQIVVRVVSAEEISDKPMQIDLNGYVRVALAGRIKVAGLTCAQVEAELTQRLKTYVLKPDVSVSIVEFRSQPVSVLGAVKNPGIQQVQGRKNVVEMLSLAGGVDSTTAGPVVRITRNLDYGPIPLPQATTDPSGKYSLVEVNLRSIQDGKSPQENIEIKPYDVISVPRADLVYVMGLVPKAGGFMMNEREPITVLKAVSLAGGLDRMAKPENSRILRVTPGSAEREEIPIDIRKILEGKLHDVPMQPDDILYVPDNIPKKAALKALDVAVQMGTGVVIWRR